MGLVGPPIAESQVESDHEIEGGPETSGRSLDQVVGRGSRRRMLEARDARDFDAVLRACGRR